MNANQRHTPPTASHRRYPSLSDDGQPWFPRAPWSRQRDNEPGSQYTSLGGDRSEFPFVAVIAPFVISAIIALFAIVAVLAITA